MDARLQRRVQRYGWDLAASEYEPLWQPQLAVAQATLLEQAELQPGERVLDIACGTGTVAHAAAGQVGPAGSVLGVDLSGKMVDVARSRTPASAACRPAFARMDGENLEIADASFDVVLCALGLMYMPDPEAALREMRRVLVPGGRVVLAVWGERSRCGWSAVFPLVDAEVASDVCPLFFRLGAGDALPTALVEAGFDAVRATRLPTCLRHADADEASRAALVGGPVALAWSRFDEATRRRVTASYLEAIAPWRDGPGYRIPAEFLLAVGRAAGTSSPRAAATAA
jgi:ubiquinone/menaquinone biosynthesis C-methylase UbiE